MGARVGRLAAAGAPPERIKRAEERRDAAMQQVRVAGGLTSKSLLWQIKDEEGHIERLDKAVEKEKGVIDSREQDIARLQGEVEASRQLLARLGEKRQEAVSRLRYLSQQKWVESIPADWVANFRDLAKSLGEANHQAYPMLRTLVDLMVPPASFDLSAADTDSDTNETIFDGSDGDGAPPGHPLPGARLAEAEGRLEDLRSRRLAAVVNAQAAGLASSSGGTKRALGEDDSKSRDAQGDVEMVPPLTVDQARELHRQQLELAAEDVAWLRRAMAEEIVPVGAGGTSVAADNVRGRQPRSGRPARGSSGGGGPTCRQRWVSAEGRDAAKRIHAGASARPASTGAGRRTPPSQGARPPGVVLGALRKEVSVRLQEQRATTDALAARVEANKHILEQEAMQRQQDREAARMDAVRQAKAEIEAARSGGALDRPQPPPAPTYGPTGQRLDERQLVRLHALAPLPRGRAGAGQCDEADIDMRECDADGVQQLGRRGRGWRRDQPVERQDDGDGRGNSRSPRLAARRLGPYW